MTYYLRTTDKDGKAFGGFQWPVQVGAVVEAPDWSPEPECGNGLHGLKDGLGGSSNLSWDADALWWIVEADEAVCIDGDKWKFPRCTVVAVGSRADVTAELYRLRPGPIHGLIMTGGYGATLTGGYGATLTGGYGATLTGGYGATLTGGDYATLTGGNYATLTGGDYATLTGGNYATLTGGDYATLTGGDYATLTGGDRATLTGGDYATLTGGDCATLTGGDYATLTGGVGATLTGGDYATLTGGDCATLTGGDYATLTGGVGATLIFLRWIGGRRRVLTAYVGEDGIEPGVAYRANDDHTAVVRAAA
jgi:hypothetical protein